MFIRLIAAVMLLLAVAPAPVFAASSVSVEEDAKNKVNLSGRQRMLIQRMAKAACFVTLGTDPEGHRRMAEEAQHLFDETLVGLMKGDAELGLLPETDPRIVKRVNEGYALWPDFSIALWVALRRPSPEALQQVMARDLQLLGAMNHAVGAFEQVYSEGVLPPDLAGAINVAGRQRMLSQKSAKEFCLVALDLDGDHASASLAASIALFEGSLQRLRTGDPESGVVAPPTGAVADQLEKTAGLWRVLRRTLDAALSGEPLRSGSRRDVVRQSEAVLIEMNRAVELYVK